MSNITWHEHQITKDARSELMRQRPFVIWITGLSGAGKSTLASCIEQRIFAMGYHCYLLDGDNVRHGLNRDLGFDTLARVENIRRVGEMAKLMVDAGLVVITAFISPFRADREMVRSMLEPREFIELHLNVDLETCEQRDPKGLYKKARLGIIKNFTGVDSPYEVPLEPEIIVGQDLTLDKEVNLVMDYLLKNGYIKT